MSDTIDDYRALKQFRQAEAATKRAEAPDWLRRLNVDFTEHNGGAHIVITVGLAIIDFWPGNDRWRVRPYKSSFGRKALQRVIEERRTIATDLADIELRVTAAYVAAMERAYPHLKGEE